MEENKNNYISVSYKLYSIDNGESEFTEEAPASRPFQFISGLGLTLEAFESQLIGLQAGDKFDFIIPQGEAYGEYDEEHVLDLPRHLFEVDGKFDTERVALGNYVPMMTANGQRVEGLVIEITDTHVTLDFNHQLAGESVRYQGEVLVVRDATDAELHPHQGCGSCSGNCGDGGCSGCSGCN